MTQILDTRMSALCLLVALLRSGGRCDNRDSVFSYGYLNFTFPPYRPPVCGVLSIPRAPQITSCWHKVVLSAGTCVSLTLSSLAAIAKFTFVPSVRNIFTRVLVSLLTTRVLSFTCSRLHLAV